MTYQLNLNLRQRAAVRAAISFWEKKDVKDKTTKFFESCGEFKISEIKNKWRQFTKAVVNEYCNDELPKTLEVELIHIVKMIGEAVFNWYQYIKHENESQYGVENEAINYIDKIHWSSYGIVDGVETVKSSWMKNPNLNVAKVYNIACTYALEEYINDLWNKIPSNVQVNYYNDIYNYFDRHILAYWECYRDDNLPNLIRHFERAASNFEEYMEEFYVFYDPNRRIEENMLRLSAYEGYSIATKYFWNKLTEEERNRNIVGCARMAVKNHIFYEQKNNGIEDYIKGQYVEICIFLMSQMTTNHKKSFFNEKIRLNIPYSFHVETVDGRDEILKMVLSTWPWQKLFVPILKDILQFQDYNNQIVCMFLDAITDKMVEDYKLGYSVKNSKYRSLLRQAWVILPASIKQNLVLQEDLKFRFICNLIDVWDMSSLKLILNDPETAAVRDELINFGMGSYEQFIIKDQFEMLDQFMEEILRSQKEKESFKRTINVWKFLITNNLFNLLDKLLHWLRVTTEEKQSIKNRIDHIGLCKYLIKIEQYDSADSLLKWKFETEEERKKCKDHFKSDEFSIQQVYEIWEKYKGNLNEAKVKSSQFLGWFLESEEEIERFKKEKVTNFEMDKALVDYMFILDNIGNINNFMNWCLLSKKVVQKIKRMLFRLKQRQSLDA